ncbi:unnamed protein product, partial [Discosporangium mesarthrocarpum]
CCEGGVLNCCAKCPRVYHTGCLRLNSESRLAVEHQDEDEDWFCPHC